MTEELVFNIKQKFLQSIPHPKVLVKYRNQLSDAFLLQKIEYKCGDKPQLVDFLENYSSHLSKVKLRIAHAIDQSELADAVNDLLELQLRLICELSKPNLPDNEGIDVKVSEEIPAHEILKFIRMNNIQDEIINSFVANQNYSKEKANFDVLSLNILKAKRIVKNG